MNETLGSQEETSIQVIKTCRICRNTKPLFSFVKNKAFLSGVDTICLECSREKVRAWRKNNKDQHNLNNRRYQKKNNQVVLAKTRRYQATKLKRVPSWADVEAIKDFYKNCPIGYHVDHIVPLQGENVSGFHVLENLQYLVSSDNLSKGNKWNP